MELPGVPGVNKNGERLGQLCAERDSIVGNPYLKKRDVHK